MAFELNLRIGRNREEKRSLPSEEEKIVEVRDKTAREQPCLLYTSPSPRDTR